MRSIVVRLSAILNGRENSILNAEDAEDFAKDFLCDLCEELCVLCV